MIQILISLENILSMAYSAFEIISSLVFTVDRNNNNNKLILAMT